MNTALAAQEDRAVSYTPTQVDLIRDHIGRGATEGELALFIAQCERWGLDPFQRQVYMIKRWDSKARREIPAFQVAIDGFRVIAERTGHYRGQEDAQWCGPDGVWVDIWLKDEPPSAARVGVYREGWKHPIRAVARWRSYVQTKKNGDPTRFWGQMPDVMLAKVAESLALRKAFPNDLSGLYSPEEIDQAQEVVSVDESVECLPPARQIEAPVEVERVGSSPPPPPAATEIPVAAELPEVPEMSEESRALLARIRGGILQIDATIYDYKLEGPFISPGATEALNTLDLQEESDLPALMSEVVDAYRRVRASAAPKSSAVKEALGITEEIEDALGVLMMGGQFKDVMGRMLKPVHLTTPEDMVRWGKDKEGGERKRVFIAQLAKKRDSLQQEVQMALSERDEIRKVF